MRGVGHHRADRPIGQVPVSKANYRIGSSSEETFRVLLADSLCGRRCLRWILDVWRGLGDPRGLRTGEDRGALPGLDWGRRSDGEESAPQSVSFRWLHVVWHGEARHVASALDVDLRDIQRNPEHLRDLLSATGRPTVPCLRIAGGEEERWMHEPSATIESLEERVARDT